MKRGKAISALLIGLTLVGLNVSCSNSEKAAKEREDSLRVADSLRQEAVARAEAIEAARQDSIAEEQKKIQRAMPTVKLFGENLHDPDSGDLTDASVLRKKLPKLGYVRKNANTFVLNPGGEPSVTVKLKEQFFEVGYTYEIKLIYSNEEDAAQFYKKWKAARKSPWLSESRSGRTVTLSTYAD